MMNSFMKLRDMLYRNSTDDKSDDKILQEDTESILQESHKFKPDQFNHFVRLDDFNDLKF